MNNPSSSIELPTQSNGAPASAPPLSEFGARLVTLCDGRPGLRGGLPAQIRAPADAGDKPIIDFLASDETLDRCDEIIVAGGWRLDAYRRNPVFQNAHQYGDIVFTLGRALITEVRGNALYQRVEFATEENPIARIAYGLYKGRFLNAVSVGFIPVRWETGGPEAGYRRKYLEQELIEVSAVGIPANPNALALGLKSGAIAAADARALLELIAALSPTLSSRPAGAETDTSALGAGANEAQWLRLARDLGEILGRA